MSEHDLVQVSRGRLFGGIALFTIGRLVLKSSARMIYPFVSVFARGMGVGLPAISLAISARSAVGALVPFTNSALDRYPRRTALLIGIGLFLAGCTLVVLWPGYAGFFIVLSLGSLGSNIFVTTSQAYIGDTVPYQYRGRAMAIVESGWSLSFLLGAPLAGLLIARFGWSSPFLVLGLLSLVVGAAVLFVIPGNRSSLTAENRVNILRNLGQVLRSPSAQAGLVLGFSLSGAIEVINMVFGVWMEDSFGLKIAALGGVAFLLGIGDLLGELFSGVLSDWIGKARAVRIGMILLALAALLLPLAGITQWWAIATIFILFFGFELAFVSSIPLLTEVLPEARATMMGAYMSASSIGLVVGALIGPLSYQRGIFYSGLAAALMTGMGLLALEKVRRGVAAEVN
jgi:predicted MFS family arabinose efflux permease